MNKFLTLFLASLLLVLMLPPVSFASPNGDVYDEVEQLVYDTLIEEDIELLEGLESNEKIQLAVFENYHYDIDGNITLEISNLEKFSEDTGLDLETAGKYINSVNRVLDIVNERSQTVRSNQNEVTPMSNTKCDYTKEILKNFTYESNYCKANTEQILDNLSTKSKVLAGIGLAGFWNPYIGISAGMGSLFSAIKHDEINKQFRNSDYKGVINRVVKVPMSPDGSYWRPLGTKWDGANPNPNP